MTASQGLAESLFLEQLQQDPYVLYEQSRAFGSVFWMEDANHWFVIGHREAMAALREPRLGNGHDFEPEHRRALGQKVLTAAAVERLRPTIQRLVTDALARVAAGGTLDVVEDFASPLTIGTISELLGVPADLQPAIRRWIRSLTDSIDPANAHGTNEDDDAEDADGSRQVATIDPPPDVQEALTALVADRAAAPRDDLISRLLEMQEHGVQLTHEEVLIFVVRLLVAGHDTTTSLISNGIAALVENPTQLERLRAEPELMPAALEELLRFDPPVQLITRYPSEDLDFLGHPMRKGQTIVVNIGAANRDPATFEDPSTLDLTRNPNPHLTFSRGMHFCLGAPLARVEAQEAIAGLLRASRNLRIGDGAVRRRSFTFRGFETLPMEF